METKYKETPIGKIPKDWKLERLSNICTKITDGTHKTPKYIGEGTPFLSSENIVPFKSGFDFSKYEKYISFKEHRELIKRCKPERGDILISKCGTIGRTKLVDVDYEFSIFVGLALLKLRKNLVSGEYLEQLLNYKPFRIRMEVSSPGSTRKTLTINAIKKLQVPLPSFQEQQKIASILSTVDKAIQHTDKAITGTERLKRGLMQELLTKGIGHKEFKDTKIGKIPSNWKIGKLGSFADIETGKRPRGGGLDEGDIASIGGEHIGKDGKVLWGNAQFIPKSFYESLNQGKLEQGDILIVKDGATTGKTAILRDKTYEKAAVNEHVFVIKSKTGDGILNEFLFYALFSKIGQNQIKHIFHGMIGGIRKKDTKFLKVPLPSLPEQRKIVKILSTIDKKLELEKKRKEKLERIKQCLMDDLLSGKKRVKVEA